jgi:hypothetical protein
MTTGDGQETLNEEAQWLGTCERITEARDSTQHQNGTAQSGIGTHHSCWAGQCRCFGSFRVCTIGVCDGTSYIAPPLSLSPGSYTTNDRERDNMQRGG